MRNPQDPGQSGPGLFWAQFQEPHEAVVGLGGLSRPLNALTLDPDRLQGKSLIRS